MKPQHLVALLLICQPGPSQERTEKPEIAPGTDIGALDESGRDLIRGHFADHAKAPIEYLKARFGEHDVVLLGEMHQIRETCEFVATSLAPLYHGAGVRCLASEFVRSRDTSKTNALVTAAEWDEEQAIALMRRGPWPTWGFREYFEILHAAWKLNSTLKPEAEKLEICGIDSDWEQYDLWFTIEDRRKRFQILMARENNMVSSLVDGPIAAKKKTLVHVGFSHTITKHGVRLGTQLRKRCGQGVFQVAMHHELGTPKRTAPLTGLLEKEHARLGGRAIGFDVVGSPLGGLRDRGSLFSTRMAKLTFGEFAEGYVILKPLAKLRRVRWIPGFIDEASFERANAVAIRLGWVKKGECKTAKELDDKAAARFGTQ